MTEARTIGLIAGQGALPVLVAQGIRAAGHRVACIGLADQYVPELPALCDDFAEAGVVRLGRWLRLARRFGVREAVMVGRVSKARMHDPLRFFRQLPDWRAIDLWYRKLRHDRRSATLLTVLADDLAKEGLVLIDSTTYIPDQMASEGVLTRRQPTAEQRSDIEFAWPLLRQVGALDIGQAIAVREKDVIAVEAVEGTDRMIERAGELCRRRGWTLVKTARPGHDMRADVPTIGVSTVERMHAAGGGCIAVGAGRVILVDRAAVLAAAERLGIAVVGVADR
ncbi:MAG: LpxI family protein [Planctomycetota bacterium]